MTRLRLCIWFFQQEEEYKKKISSSLRCDRLLFVEHIHGAAAEGILTWVEAYSSCSLRCIHPRASLTPTSAPSVGQEEAT